MTVTKVRRMSNPHKRKRRNPKAKRRRLTAKQIRHFGTKAQRAALKRRTKAKRGTTAKRRNPARRKRTARRNPAHMITLGFINPHVPGTRRRKRKGTSMAKRRKTAKRKNPSVRRRRRSTTRRRRNSNIVVMGGGSRRRRRNPARRTSRRRTARRRNPMPGGGGKGTLELLAGVLAGVGITKYVVNTLPAAFTSTPLTRALSAAGVGYFVGFGVERFAKQRGLGEGIMLGGLAEASGIVLNTYLPSVGGAIGLGDFVPGYVNPPVNPVTYRPPVMIAPPSPKTQGIGAIRSMHAAFGGAL